MATVAELEVEVADLKARLDDARHRFKVLKNDIRNLERHNATLRGEISVMLDYKGPRISAWEAIEASKSRLKGTNWYEKLKKVSGHEIAGPSSSFLRHAARPPFMLPLDIAYGTGEDTKVITSAATLGLTIQTREWMDHRFIIIGMAVPSGHAAMYRALTVNDATRVRQALDESRDDMFTHNDFLQYDDPWPKYSVGLPA